jgi:AcrR family transcriptional regulator
MRKRAEPREPGLTREMIVSTSLTLMDERGVQAFSMRKLAQQLGVSPQALYWHFDNRDDLCRAVVELARREIVVENDESMAPIERVRALMWSLREHAARHPAAVELGRHYAPTMAGEVTENGVAILQAMGFTDRSTALDQFRALLWTVVGFAAIEHGARDSIHHTRLDDEHVVYAVRINTGDDAERANPSPPDVVDVDRLFSNVVEIFVAGLEVRLAAGATRY